MANESAPARNRVHAGESARRGIKGGTPQTAGATDPQNTGIVIAVMAIKAMAAFWGSWSPRAIFIGRRDAGAPRPGKRPEKH